VSQGVSCPPNPRCLLVLSIQTNSMRVFLHALSGRLPAYLPVSLPPSQILTTDTSEVSYRQADGKAIKSNTHSHIIVSQCGCGDTLDSTIPEYGIYLSAVSMLWSLLYLNYLSVYFTPKFPQW
jgi:hypothetical protein